MQYLVYLKSKSISGNTTTELLTQPLVMEESEILKVQSGYVNEAARHSFNIRNTAERGRNVMQVLKPKEIITIIST